MTEWRNWSGSVTAQPADIARPKSAAELSAIVARAGKVRVVGAGHSFMPLCQTDGVLISMADYRGSIEIAPDRKTAWAPAGWGLDRLTAALWAEGLSLINQGDINPQSLAGATATGTTAPAGQSTASPMVKKTSDKSTTQHKTTHPKKHKKSSFLSELFD